MDFDREAQCLYTGDEMGFMNKWDVSKLIEKLDKLKPADELDDEDIPETERSSKKNMKRAATFITGFNESLVKTEFIAEELVENVHRWQAHKEFINQVTFVPELDVFATCSFDCNVYMWNKDTCKQVGSLILGTGLQQSSQQTEAERRRYARVWQIKIDKQQRYKHDRHEAEVTLKSSLKMDYDTMFLKKGEKQEEVESAETPKAIEQKPKFDGDKQTDEEMLKDLDK